MLTALAGLLALMAVGSYAGRGMVEEALRQGFGSAHRDRAIEADPLLVGGTLMSKDPLDGDARWIVSYEYFHGLELYVGYARVPADAAVAWTHLDPLDVELAADRPELSRPAGVILAPNGWITDGWRAWAPWLSAAQLALALGLGALGISRVRSSR